MKKTKSLSPLILICMLLLFNTASAQIVMVTNPVENDYTYSGETVGTKFSVGATDLIVNAFGIYDQSENGLSGSYDMGLYDSSGSLLGSDTILSGTSSVLSNGYRWETLDSTITLTAGQTYTIAAYRPDQNDLFPWINSGEATVDANVTLLDDVYNFGGSLTFPSSVENRLAIAGVNLQYTVVPEPSTYAAIFGIFSLAFVAYKKKRKA